MTKPYYTAMCGTCHETFINLSIWQMIKEWFKHKHLLHAILHSDVAFYKQTGYEEAKQ